MGVRKRTRRLYFFFIGLCRPRRRRSEGGQATELGTEADPQARYARVGRRRGGWSGLGSDGVSRIWRVAQRRGFYGNADRLVSRRASDDRTACRQRVCRRFMRGRCGAWARRSCHAWSHHNRLHSPRHTLPCPGRPPHGALVRAGICPGVEGFLSAKKPFTADVRRRRKHQSTPESQGRCRPAMPVSAARCPLPARLRASLTLPKHPSSS